MAACFHKTLQWSCHIRKAGLSHQKKGKKKSQRIQATEGFCWETICFNYHTISCSLLCAIAGVRTTEKFFPLSSSPLAQEPEHSRQLRYNSLTTPMFHKTILKTEKGQRTSKDKSSPRHQEQEWVATGGRDQASSPTDRATSAFSSPNSQNISSLMTVHPPFPPSPSCSASP